MARVSRHPLQMFRISAEIKLFVLLFLFLLQLLMLHGAHLGGKAEQIDEAFRIMMIVRIFRW